METNKKLVTGMDQIPSHKRDLINALNSLKVRQPEQKKDMWCNDPDRQARRFC